MAIERITDGTVMRTEFQKPTLMPSQSSPVQASAQALTQGCEGRAPSGQAKMLPRRISSMRLERGHDHHVERQQEEERRDDQEGVDADARRR